MATGGGEGVQEVTLTVLQGLTPADPGEIDIPRICPTTRGRRTAASLTATGSRARSAARTASGYTDGETGQLKKTGEKLARLAREVVDESDRRREDDPAPDAGTRLHRRRRARRHHR